MLQWSKTPFSHSVFLVFAHFSPCLVKPHPFLNTESDDWSAHTRQSQHRGSALLCFQLPFRFTLTIIIGRGWSVNQKKSRKNTDGVLFRRVRGNETHQTSTEPAAPRTTPEGKLLTRLKLSIIHLRLLIRAFTIISRERCVVTAN